MKRRTKRRLLFALVLCFLVSVGTIFVYVRTHPLVFNESFLMHAHCIKSVAIGLESYALDNGGYYPLSDKGYADALAMTHDSTWMLTGPGYTKELPEEAKQGDIPENLCGRVYIQGLKQGDDWNTAILFDKMATPGGDHCHFPRRLRAPMGREVLYICASRVAFIPETEWAEFASQQIETLVAAGIPRDQAEWYYDQADE